jgi:hypothetical protein
MVINLNATTRKWKLVLFVSGIVQIIFLSLKLLGEWDIPWSAVFVPIWILPVLLIVSVVVTVVMAIIWNWLRGGE